MDREKNTEKLFRITFTIEIKNSDSDKWPTFIIMHYDIDLVSFLCFCDLSSSLYCTQHTLLRYSFSLLSAYCFFFSLCTLLRSCPFFRCILHHLFMFCFFLALLMSVDAGLHFILFLFSAFFHRIDCKNQQLSFFVFLFSQSTENDGQRCYCHQHQHHLHHFQIVIVSA